MTFLIALFARWGLPESIRRPLALASTIIAVAALCGLLWTCWLGKHDTAVVEKHEAAITQAVATQSAAAATAAASAASQTRSTVENTNDEARAAAARSPDDPLRAGIDRLRTDQGAPKPAPR